MTPQIQLISLDRSFLNDEYISWLNDPSVTRFLEVRHQLQNFSTITEYYEQIKGNPQNIWRAIVHRDNEQHIGNIKCTLSRYGVGEMSLFIGNKNYRRRGVGTEAVRLMSDIAFGAGAVKLVAFIYSSNYASQRTFSKCEYTLEAVLHNEVIDMGKRADLLRFVKYPC